jgi:hypothetical protein
LDIHYRDGLIKSLEGFTKTLVLENEAGSTVLTEYGARILGVFIGGRQNPFWVPGKLQELISRKERDIGGNRLWVSPERNFFYKRPHSFEGWFCQQSLDPGNWQVESSSKSSVTLEEELELEDFLKETKINLSLSRQISSSGIRVKKDLGCVKLKVREAMLARGNLKNGISLWSLTQIRPGGTVLIPTRPKAKPIHYFSKIPRDRLKISRDHVSFKIDGMAVYKLGIMPEDMVQPGFSRIAYYVEHDENDVFLILMKTLMAPVNQEECVDVAKADPLGPKGCIQSYNSGPDLGFGEMEFHFKPAVKIKDSWISHADYDIDVFSGKRGEVLRILKKIVPKPFLL